MGSQIWNDCLVDVEDEEVISPILVFSQEPKIREFTKIRLVRQLR